MTQTAVPIDAAVTLPSLSIATLMPMHLWVDDDFRLKMIGPALKKMLPETVGPGAALTDVIEMRGPGQVTNIEALRALAGRRLSLSLPDHPDLPLRGVVVAMAEGDGVLMDVSLGLSFVRAVALFGLTLHDFSPCDQTIELLYLFEANASIRSLSRRLSERLDAARAEAEAQALTDALTGLNNRRAMDLALQRCLDDRSEEFVLLHIDLDLFKQVNDTYGHAAGDAVLERVGEVLNFDLRATDIAGRVGGDEFLVILREYSAATDVAAIATRLIAELERPIPFDGQVCQISASIGITNSADYAERPSVDAILADTDLALYQAKRSGRGRFMMFADMPTVLPVARRAEDPTPREPEPPVSTARP